MHLKRILVPTDFSPPSLAALKYTSTLVDAKSTEVIVAFVIEPIAYAPVDYGYASADFGMVYEEQQRAARAQLKRLERRWRARLPRLRTVLLTGAAASSIVAAARNLKVQMIVMATHGRTGLTHLVLGSVAERVLRTAQCPVLTVRSRAPVPRAAARTKSQAKKRAHPVTLLAV